MTWSLFNKAVVILNASICAIVMAGVITVGGTLPATKEPSDATGTVVFIVLYVLANLVASLRAAGNE